MTGGNGRDGVRAFYEHLVHRPLAGRHRGHAMSRTVGETGLVDELIISFTHDCEMPALLPGITPTGT